MPKKSRANKAPIAPVNDPPMFLPNGNPNYRDYFSFTLQMLHGMFPKPSDMSQSQYDGTMARLLIERIQALEAQNH